LPCFSSLKKSSLHEKFSRESHYSRSKTFDSAFSPPAVFFYVLSFRFSFSDPSLLTADASTRFQPMPPVFFFFTPAHPFPHLQKFRDDPLLFFTSPVLSSSRRLSLFVLRFPPSFFPLFQPPFRDVARRRGRSTYIFLICTAALVFLFPNLFPAPYDIVLMRMALRIFPIFFV